MKTTINITRKMNAFHNRISKIGDCPYFLSLIISCDSGQLYRLIPRIIFEFRENVPATESYMPPTLIWRHGK
jgi:hypothetical protein